MRPFKPFWGWIKNTSFSPTQGFSILFFAPKFSPPTYFPPSYLPPTSYLFTSFPTHSISRGRESSRTWVTQSFEEMLDIRLEEGAELNIEGMWRGESKRNVSSQMQKQKKKGKLPPFSTFYFFYGFFFLCFFFFFFCLRRRRCQEKVFETKG